MKKTVYLAHYASFGHGTSPAGIAVMEYVINCFRSMGQELTVISSVETEEADFSRREPEEGSINFVFPTFPKEASKKNILGRLIRKLRYNRTLYRELAGTLEDGDTLLVYHSTRYMRILKRLIRKKKIDFVLQVCEIYGDVTENQKTKKKELAFFKLADKFIFQAERLAQLINRENKPYLILYGTYRIEPNRGERLLAKVQADEGERTIHCVYAGTFDPRKGGVAAAASGQFLDEKYHVHIIGFGSESDKSLLIHTVEEASRKTKCKITYDGLLSGEDYIRFLQSCDIGLSTQNPNADFNDTSFPSKVLSYMANGLRVVSVKIKALETSAVNDLLYYYEGDQPEQIAEAIRRIDINDGYDSRKVITELDKSFKKALKELLYENSSEN